MSQNDNEFYPVGASKIEPVPQETLIKQEGTTKLAGELSEIFDNNHKDYKKGVDQGEAKASMSEDLARNNDDSRDTDFTAPTKNTNSSS